MYQMSNGSYYSYFICPLGDDDDSYTYCCGAIDRQTCCSVFQKNSEIAGSVGNVGNPNTWSSWSPKPTWTSWNTGKNWGSWNSGTSWNTWSNSNSWNTNTRPRSRKGARYLYAPVHLKKLSLHDIFQDHLYKVLVTVFVTVTGKCSV